MKNASSTSIRFPKEIRDWLETRSIRNFRSVGAEVVAILTAVREGEKTGLGFEKFANPSSIITEEEAA